MIIKDNLIAIFSQIGLFHYRTFVFSLSEISFLFTLGISAVDDLDF